MVEIVVKPRSKRVKVPSIPHLLPSSTHARKTRGERLVAGVLCCHAVPIPTCRIHDLIVSKLPSPSSSRKHARTSLLLPPDRAEQSSSTSHHCHSTPPPPRRAAVRARTDLHQTPRRTPPHLPEPRKLHSGHQLAGTEPAAAAQTTRTSSSLPRSSSAQTDARNGSPSTFWCSLAYPPPPSLAGSAAVRRAHGHWSTAPPPALLRPPRTPPRPPSGALDVQRVDVKHVMLESNHKMVLGE